MVKSDDDDVTHIFSLLYRGYWLLMTRVLWYDTKLDFFFGLAQIYSTCGLI